MRKIGLLFILAAAAIIGWLFWQQSRPQPLVVSGFIEADQIRVGSRVGGRVASVEVVEGQRVRGGQVMFSIEPFDLMQRLAGAQANLAASRAESD